MQGYVVTGLEPVDFQLSSQLLAGNEANQAEVVLRKDSAIRKDISWTILSFQDLKDVLEADTPAVIALSGHALPYKKYLAAAYPKLILMDYETNTVLRVTEKFEIMMIGTLLFTLIILISLAYVF
jgi:hypothetical protein